MSFNKKSYLVMLFLFCFIIALLSYYNFSKNSRVSTVSKEEKTLDIQNFKSNSTSIVDSKIAASETTFQENSDSQPAQDESLKKAEKALLSIKQKNRKPSTQNIFNPKSTLSHQLLDLTDWKLWPHVKAISANEKNQSDVALVEINNLLIVEDDIASANLANFNRNQPVVLFNQRLKKAGILTGTIKVETADKNDLLNDLATANAGISDSFEAIQTYFINSNDEIFNLEKLYTFLKQKSYIKHIELEILSRTYEKN